MKNFRISEGLQYVGRLAAGGAPHFHGHLPEQPRVPAGGRPGAVDQPPGRHPLPPSPKRPPRVRAPPAALPQPSALPRHVHWKPAIVHPNHHLLHRALSPPVTANVSHNFFFFFFWGTLFYFIFYYYFFWGTLFFIFLLFFFLRDFIFKKTLFEKLQY